MINILRDITGVSETNMLIIPFQLYDLPEDPMNIELVVFKRTRSTEMVTNHFIYRVLENGDEEETLNINQEDEGRTFLIKINTSTLNVDQLYIRIYNKTMSFLSSNIYVLDSESLFFMAKNQEFKKRPKKIKVIDVVDTTSSNTVVPFNRSYFDIQVLVTNNFTSNSPVWENMTDEYLNNEIHTFTNKTKDSDKDWSVSIKYIVNKITKNSTVEFSDIKLVVM